MADCSPHAQMTALDKRGETYWLEVTMYGAATAQAYDVLRHGPDWYLLRRDGEDEARYHRVEDMTMVRVITQ